MDKKDKEIIVAAAIKRFSHYGYSKTAMAEIAADCDMSVGNLYRFYKNKEDIAVEGARTCMVDKAEAGELAATQAKSPALALNAYCLARLRYLHRFVSDTPHMFELVELIAGKHKDVLQQFEDRACRAIRTIIVDGVDRGVFRRCNAEEVAMDIYNATTKYNMPLCMDASLSQLEAELGSLLDLVHAGLKAEKKS
ncbi:MAG: TetR/AcrR family transcriptional regulator [Mariprofundus sp.]|nr:TetR/AcrR family transcriptional regulator [Mariprofundus sp.]